MPEAANGFCIRSTPLLLTNSFSPADSECSVQDGVCLLANCVRQTGVFQGSCHASPSRRNALTSAGEGVRTRLKLTVKSPTCAV